MDSAPIAGHDRLVVVLGMAHSGTTILTHVLSQHPDMRLAVGGREAWILENDWLPTEDGASIGDLLAVYPERRLLLKRPWNTVWHSEWMLAAMPEARFVYCQRAFEVIAASWSKRTSFVDVALREGDPAHQRRYYDLCLESAELFAGNVPHFRKAHHDDLLRNPAAFVGRLAAWLGLRPFAFDVSGVGADKDVKLRLAGGSRRLVAEKPVE